MPEIKTEITHAKEEYGYIWLYVHHRWIAIDKHIFEHYFKDRLVEELYGHENRRIEKEIYNNEREMKRLRHEGKELEARSREYHIMHLKSQIKREVAVQDIAGKRIKLDLF
jgi:hypothetical protein